MAVFALLLSGCAFAQDCNLSSDRSDDFSLKLRVDSAGGAEMSMTALIPYSQECLLEGSQLKVSGSCDAVSINDAIFRSMDFFIIRSDCN